MGLVAPGGVPSEAEPAVGRRRQGRELALQVLYELDVRGETDPGPIVDDLWRRQSSPEEVRAFADALVRGTAAHRPKIDELITRFAERWDLERMAVVDRNILRMGIFELLWGGDATPAKVVINEALEIARKFSTGESTRFINGLLDRIRREFLP
jgi:N utilization substance protein B